MTVKGSHCLSYKYRQNLRPSKSLSESEESKEILKNSMIVRINWLSCSFSYLCDRKPGINKLRGGRVLCLMVSAVSFCHGRKGSSHHISMMRRGGECGPSFSIFPVILSDPQLITDTVQYQGNSVLAITLTDTQKCTLVISSVLLNPIHPTDKIKRHRYQSGIGSQI